MDTSHLIHQFPVGIGRGSFCQVNPSLKVSWHSKAIYDHEIIWGWVKTCTPVVHIKIAGSYGSSSPKIMVFRTVRKVRKVTWMTFHSAHESRWEPLVHRGGVQTFFEGRTGTIWDNLGQSESEAMDFYHCYKVIRGFLQLFQQPILGNSILVA